MRISLIAAHDEERGIGKDNDLLWRIPEDLQRFKALTTGHPIIMGRKTYQSIGRPLPDRTNIVITRNPEFAAPGCLVVGSLEDSLAEAAKVEDEEVFVIGGGEIYQQALPKADRLHLTIVDGTHGATVFFPEYADRFEVQQEEPHSSDGYDYRFVTLVRQAA